MLSRLPVLFGWILFVAAIAWPTVALLVQSLVDGRLPIGGLTYSSRQFGLLGRSVLLSGAGAIGCVALSLPAAMAFVHLRGGKVTTLFVGLMATLVLCPPMVYTFAWQRALPAATPAWIQCLITWMLWAWPLPAMLIAAGWRRSAHSCYEAALLDTGPLGAWLHVVLPILLPFAALGGLVLFILFLGDYGVPHAAGLIVYSTELLGWATTSRFVLDTAWPALPVVAVTGLAVVGAIRLWRARWPTSSPASRTMLPVPSHASRWAEVCLWLLIGVALLVPIGRLLIDLTGLSELREALRTYAVELLWSVGCAFLGGVLVVAISLSLSTSPRGRPLAVFWSLMFGAVPGALVGTALVAAYGHSAWGSVYDYPPIVVLSYVARFLWMGMLAAMLVRSQTARDVLDLARLDGVPTWTVWTRLIVPLHRGTLLAVAGMVAVQSLSEIAATTLVRVPTFAPIAHVLIEAFHRFEDGLLIALSLCLFAVAVPAAVLLSLLVRRAGP